MKKVRFISLLLIVCLLVSNVPAGALSGDVQITPFRYTAIMTLSASLKISSNVATCKGTCTLRYSDYTVSMLLELQQYKDGKWTTIKPWTDSQESYIALSKTYAVPSGYYYRTIASAYVYDADGYFVESDTVASNEVYY